MAAEVFAAADLAAADLAAADLAASGLARAAFAAAEAELALTAGVTFFAFAPISAAFDAFAVAGLAIEVLPFPNGDLEDGGTARRDLAEDVSAEDFLAGEIFAAAFDGLGLADLALVAADAPLSVTLPFAALGLSSLAPMRAIPLLTLASLAPAALTLAGFGSAAEALAPRIADLGFAADFSRPATVPTALRVGGKSAFDALPASGVLVFAAGSRAVDLTAFLET